MFTFPLGARVRDTITGYEGIITARTEFINGCKRYAVQSENLDKDGKIVEPCWLDEEQLVAKGKPLALTQRPTGGPRPDAPPPPKGM
jgi:hypothetical protein